MYCEIRSFMFFKTDIIHSIFFEVLPSKLHLVWPIDFWSEDFSLYLFKNSTTLPKGIMMEQTLIYIIWECFHIQVQLFRTYGYWGGNLKVFLYIIYVKFDPHCGPIVIPRVMIWKIWICTTGGEDAST